MAGHYHKPSDYFKYPPKITTKSSHSKDTSRIFLPPKIPGIEKFNPYLQPHPPPPKKNSFHHPRHLKSGVAPPPCCFFFYLRHWWVLQVFTPRISLNLCLYCCKELMLRLLRFFPFAKVSMHVEVCKKHDQRDAIQP